MPYLTLTKLTERDLHRMTRPQLEEIAEGPLGMDPWATWRLTYYELKEHVIQELRKRGSLPRA